MTDWIDVRKKLPEIPKGRYGIQVIVCTYDPHYDEWNSSFTSNDKHKVEFG